MREDLVVRAKNIKKLFNNFVAVDNINFHIAQGECFGILGPNGAGKTTTVRMVSCFMLPTAGELEVFGLSVKYFPRQIKTKLGICQQEDNLDPDLNVFQNMLVFSRYFNIKKKEAISRIDRLLDFVGLVPREKSRINELSRGMKRRLIIARSLLNNPELLLLDEPTTGLDPQSRHKIWDNIMELKSRKVSFLLTTHYMEEAEHLCDRIIIMDRGKIIVHGKPQDLIKSIVGENAIEIFGYSKSVEELIKQRGEYYDKTSSRIIIFSKNPERILAEILKASPHIKYTIRMTNLEDVFIRFTGRELKE